MRRGVRGIGAGACVSAVLLLSVVFASCGDGDDRKLAELLPADLDWYVESVLVPDDEQGEIIEELASHFPGGDDLGAEITAALQADFDGDGVDVDAADEFIPAFGHELALGGRLDGTATYGAMELDDPDQLEEILPRLEETDEDIQRAEHEGVDYTYTNDPADTLDATAVAEGRLLFASDPEAMEALIDVVEANAPSLEESDPGLPAALEEAEDEDTLVAGAVQVEDFFADAAEQEGVDPAAIDFVLARYGLDPSQPIVFAAGADAGRAHADITYSSPPTATSQLAGAGDVLPDVPGDAVGAVGLGHLGEVIEANFLGFAATVPNFDARLRREAGFDVVSAVEALGDGAVFVRSNRGAELGGGVIIEVADSAALRAALPAAKEAARNDPDTTSISSLPSGLPEDATGFSMTGAGVPGGLDVVLTDDRLILGYGTESTKLALNPDGTLGDERLPAAADTLGDGFRPSLVVDTLSAVEIVNALDDEAGAADYLAARPFLEPLGPLVGGAKTEGDRTHMRFAVSVP